MNQIELSEVIEKHRKWLNDEEDGVMANLCNVDLHGANLAGIDLRRAKLNGANLRDTNLCNADLRGANLIFADLCNADLADIDLRHANLCCTDLHNVNLCYANLRYASLRTADLSSTDLCNADLTGAILCCAKLNGTNLCGANLRDANLCHADLHGVKYNERTAFFAMQCPEEGVFTGYKAADGYIIKLEICANAKRSSSTSRKCRCSAAKVISITNLDGSPSGLSQVTSDYDGKFVYKVGEVVAVDNFDEDRWHECSTGIHFFITRQEAVNYI